MGNLGPRERQLVGGRGVGGDRLADHGVCKYDDDARHKDANGDGEKPTHDTKGQVLAVLDLEHLERHGDGEDDRRAGHVTGHHGHDPALARLCECVCQLVATHVNGNEGRGRHGGVCAHRTKERPKDRGDKGREVGGRRHDARHRQEDGANGVYACDKLLA